MPMLGFKIWEYTTHTKLKEENDLSRNNRNKKRDRDVLTPVSSRNN
jgi:hypothetical protein|tara:strand:+ start:427 stop:564 length:138 start_codon:yes stop_codon:yes gene_type:complete